MSQIGARAALAALTLALAAPAGAAGLATHTQSCMAKSGENCSEWDVMAAGPQLQPKLENACRYARGKLAMSPCPSRKRVGVCTYPPGSGVQGSRLVFYRPTTGKKARETCSQEKGVFSEK